MHKTLFLSLLCLTLFLGCTKKKKDTSPYTSSEYFTCFVNGQEWVASTPNNPNGPPAVRAEFYPPDNSLTVKGNLKYGNQYLETLFFALSGVMTTGDYNMVIGNGNIVGFESISAGNCGIYYHDSASIGHCTILQFDHSTNRIEGSFSMQLSNPNCPDSILTITNGHFSTYFQ